MTHDNTISSLDYRIRMLDEKIRHYQGMIMVFEDKIRRLKNDRDQVQAERIKALGAAHG